MYSDIKLQFVFIYLFLFFAEGIPETFTIIATFKQKKMDPPQGTKKLKIPLLTIYNAEEAREIIGLYVGLRTMFLYSDNTIKNTKPVRFNFNTNDDRWDIYVIFFKVKFVNFFYKELIWISGFI